MTDETAPETLPKTRVESLAGAEKAYAAAVETVISKAPAAKPAKALRAAAKKPAASKTPVVKSPAAKPAAKKLISAKAKPAKKLAAAALSPSKDTLMTTAKTFTASLKDTFAEVQTKAKTVYGKGAAALADAGEFTKGNAEALVESGKILSTGIKTLGSDYVAESKKAYETLTADAKELAAVKSPTDFFQLQSDIMRRNFDSAIALSSKNTEAALKLVNDAFAPISGRVSLAVAAVKKAA